MTSRIFSEKTNTWVENVWRKHAPQIYKQCRIRSSSKESADDLFQEVAFRFCKFAPILNTDASLWCWFRTVIAHTHCEMYRKGGKVLPISHLSERLASYDSYPESVSVHFQDNQEQKSIQDELRFFLEGLAPLERMIVEVSFLGGVTLLELSRILGLSKSNLSRIRSIALKKMAMRKFERDLQMKKMDAPTVLLEDLLTSPVEIS